MTYSEEDFLQLSGIQHFAFCRRQWALIHLEDQWAENLRTVEGGLLHKRAHDEKQRERRGDTLILRDLPVFSSILGVSGKCDVVEFRTDPSGISLRGEEGMWRPYPVEYKRGRPKEHQADELLSLICCGDFSGRSPQGERGLKYLSPIAGPVPWSVAPRKGSVD